MAVFCHLVVFGFVSCAADVDGALALLQWVLSAKPDATVAEQQLQAAVKLVSTGFAQCLAGGLQQLQCG